jgi:hypothetical protein
MCIYIIIIINMYLDVFNYLIISILNHYMSFLENF